MVSEEQAIAETMGLFSFKKPNGKPLIDVTKEDLQACAQVINFLQPTRILEIGTYYGGLMYFLCRVCHDSVRFVAVDNWAQQKHENWPVENYWNILGPYQERIELRIENSDVGPKEEDKINLFDLIIFDAQNSFDAVERDLNVWLPVLSPEGMFMLHGAGETVHSVAGMKEVARQLLHDHIYKIQFKGYIEANWGVFRCLP